MAQPGPSDALEKLGSDASPMSQNGVKLLLESLSKQVESKGKPPFSPFPPPAFANQPGPHPFHEPPMKDFAGIPIGRGPPQNAFPVAPGPPKKIWILEQEMIRMAQASNPGAGVGSPQRIETPPPAHLGFVHVQPRPVRAPMPMKPIEPQMTSTAQTNRVWQHLFPNQRIGTPSQPHRDAMPDRPEPLKPAELGSLGLKQILGKVVDVMELESVLGLNQPSIRPPPGFENFPKPGKQPEKPGWLLQKGAMPPPAVSNSPQHGVSLLSQWRKPSLDQIPVEPKTASRVENLVGMPLIANNPVAAGPNRPEPRNIPLPREEPPKGPTTKDNFQRFWDSFSDPYAHKSKRGSAGQDNPVTEASNKLENLALKEKRDPRFPERGEEEKEKKRKKKSKKRSKKTSESAETSVEPPAPVVEPAPSPPNGEKAPDRKRPRRKSKNKKSKIDSGAFEDYLDIDSVIAGLENGSLIKGEIRINAKNYKECYINHPCQDTLLNHCEPFLAKNFPPDHSINLIGWLMRTELPKGKIPAKIQMENDKKDVLINGTLDRNRALEGDVVVVQLKSEEECLQTSPSSAAQMTAKVVYILEKVHSRYCVGHLTKIGEKDYATLCPRDSRIPRLLIPVTTLSMQIIQNPAAYENILFKAKIVTWDSPNFAQGIIEEELGRKGDIDVETLAILKELHLDGEPVPEQLSQHLPSFTITQEEIDRRLDLRKDCIFTIDPATARDLDDAVSFKKLGDDLFEVGVHISDVSHFLELGTPLDVKVSERATTIYLVDKAIHMLPLELCLQCSLLPGQDKFAVSVIWQMDSQGIIRHTKFARTVIHSCAKLSYEHAQAIIDGVEVELPSLYNNVTPDKIRESILGLYTISKNMTKRRFDGGALRIDQPKVCFRINENALPFESNLYELKESNRARAPEAQR